MIGNGEMTSISPCPQVLVASSTSLGAVSEFFYGDSLQAVKAAHAAETATFDSSGTSLIVMKHGCNIHTRVFGCFWGCIDS